MTGDGVNDCLALKEADCSIAMASGSDAARNVSQLVLLDSNFKSMPNVVAEGRRTINNIERSASLFLIKTIYSCILAILFLFINKQFPFMPIQLSLISIVTIGIPSFVLALEPNKERIKGHFLRNVVRNALPSSVAIIGNIVIILIATFYLDIPDEVYSSLCVILTVITGFLVQIKICYPYNLLRIALIVTTISLFLFGTIFMNDWFSILLPKEYMPLLLLLVITSIMLFAICHAISYLIERRKNTL